MIKELNKDKRRLNSQKSKIVHRLQSQKQVNDTKLDKLLDTHLDGLIESNQYQQKRGQLVNQNIDLDQQLKEIILTFKIGSNQFLISFFPPNKPKH